MLIPLLIVAVQSFAADTLLVPGVKLLGEPVERATYVREGSGSEGRVPFSVYASMPLPATDYPGLPVHLIDPPAELGFTRSELDHAIRRVEEEVYRGGFPGAALAIGRWNRTVVERGIGSLERGLGAAPVDPDHAIYDLASLTKVIATTTAVMLLVEDGRLDLDDQVVRYLPEFGGGQKDWVTIRHLLTHSSGLPAGGNASGPTPAAALSRVLAIPLKRQPGEKVEYSDIGFITLWAAAEAAYGSPLEDLLQSRVFEPLGMHVTNFRPGESCRRCAPTDERPGYRGVVHDPLARRLGGVAGHAGLFSTVHDLSLFAAMLVNGGELNGVRVFDRSTVELFTRRHPGAETRALGWDTPALNGTGAGGLHISSAAFGHTGFTGTSLWVDPQRGTWVVLLANRTFAPSGPNRMQALRRELNDRVAVSVDGEVGLK